MTMIHCYLLKNFHKCNLPDDYLTRLGAAQRTRISSMGSKRKHEYFFSRQLLTFAVAKHNSSKDWQIIEQKNNTPLIKTNNNQAINLSITHSSTWLGVAVCTEKEPPKIGIDIETIRRNWSIEKATLFCNDTQIKHAFNLNKTSERDNFLTKTWTQKEAHFKAGGASVFNKDLELKENGKTRYSLISNPLSDGSIMSVYSEHNAVVNSIRLSYLHGQFVAI